MTYRPCWLCGSTINPSAPETSAAAGIRVRVNGARLEHVHDLCFQLHRRVAERPESHGRLSVLEYVQVLVVDEETAERIADRIANPRPPDAALRALFRRG